MFVMVSIGLLVALAAAPGAAQAAGAGAGGGTPALAASPQATNPTPGSGTPGAGPTDGVDAECQEAVTGIGAGKRTAMDALPTDKRTRLVGHDVAGQALTCLAVAENQATYCDVLPDEARDRCRARFKLLSSLKDLPKEALKPRIMFEACLADAPEADCQKAQKALTAGDASLCEGLSAESGAWGGGLCAALASGDPKYCDGAPRPEYRDACAALATDDPSRCPKDNTDCINMARAFSVMKKEGLAGGGVDEPDLAALHQGKKACAPLLSEWARTCGPAEAAPATTPAASPQPSPPGSAGSRSRTGNTTS